LGIVVVALGEPSVPVTCCAPTCVVPINAATTAVTNAAFRNLMSTSNYWGKACFARWARMAQK
jgi:hypothetical protein